MNMASAARKVILLTGATGGLGRKLAPLFVQDNHQLALVGRDDARLQMVLEHCRAVAPRTESVMPVNGDLSTVEGAKRVAERVVERFDGIDVLINNAGVSHMDNIHETSEDLFDSLLKDNLKTAFCMTAAAVPHLKLSGGCLINISSLASLRQVPGYTCYGMAKAALDHFTRSVAVDLAPSGVRVNSINPGEIRTEPYPGMSQKEYHKWNVQSGQATPLGRICDVSDVYNVITFLMSDGADFITGSNIPLDGAFGLTFNVHWK